MPASSLTVIGYIVDVQGGQLTATLVEDEQGHAPTVTISDEDVLVGQLGSYVAVRQNDVHVIAVVTRMTEQEALAAPTIETPGDDSARLQPFRAAAGSVLRRVRFRPPDCRHRARAMDAGDYRRQPRRAP